ncbi:hypothetical protein J1N35_024325 [Gossypium stocksii]|uniref:Uncharacterized protein n=1 Tax=Gossypium stocksii TaxID=47602 RepID=A0A9D3V466_9ROSI|nr:hypothetical protein J1N35_024325 [Gossypium stocksii]
MGYYSPIPFSLLTAKIAVYHSATFLLPFLSHLWRFNSRVVLEDFNTEALRRSLHTDARSRVTTFFSLRNPLFSTAISLSLPAFPSSSSTVKAKPSIFSHHHLFIAKNVPSSSLFSSSTKITKQIRTAFKIKCSSASFSNTLPSALLFYCDGVLVDTDKDGHRKELGVTWDVDLYGELLKIGGGKERMTAYFNKTGWPDKAPKSEEERKAFIASLHKQKTELFMALIENRLLPLRPGVAKGLISLPNEIQHLTLLSNLEIEHCYNLMSLPQGVRNLTALQKLRIIGCPQLQRRCKKLRGEDWPNIAHILSIQIQNS